MKYQHKICPLFDTKEKLEFMVSIDSRQTAKASNSYQIDRTKLNGTEREWPKLYSWSQFRSFRKDINYHYYKARNKSKQES